MSTQTTRRQHYVPQFLLRPWAIDGLLRGYYWSKSKADIDFNERGTKAFCYELDLLSLQSSYISEDAIEADFFGWIDDQGAKVRDKLLKSGLKNVTEKDRGDFARLLLSLEARRPANVERLKSEAPEFIRRELDGDKGILEAFKENSISATPSTWLQQHSSISMQDRALLLIQKLVDNPTVGKFLINGYWHVFDLSDHDGTLLLGDRPVVRTGCYSAPRTVWAPPLSPKKVFMSFNSKEAARSASTAQKRQLRKSMNRDSVNQMDRFSFMVDRSNIPLLRKHLSPRYVAE